MKKALLSIYILSFSTLPVFSQAPTITSADAYKVNEVAVQYNADTSGIVPGTAGANVTWDFTGLKAAAAKDSTASKYVYSGSTPYGTDFPNADFATQSFSGKTYSYLTFKNNTVSLIGTEGEQISNGQTVIVKQIYDKPEILFAYPLTYNTNQNNDFHAYYDIQGITVYLTGNQKVAGDAYGTLKIMNKTFSNVLRLHVVTVQSDSFAGLPNGIVTNSESWSYITPGKKDAILTIFIYSQMGLSGKSVTYNINSVTAGINNPTLSSTDLNVYPNPAQKNCTLRFNAQNESKVAVSLMNELGQQVGTQYMHIISGMNSIPLDISGLSKGIYFVNINSGSGLVVQKLVVE